MVCRGLCGGMLVVAVMASWSLAEDKPGDAVCRRATGKIVVDGKGDEPAWKSASVITDFHQAGANPPKPGKTRTTARLLWDDEALYFLAEMEDADLFADVTEHDGVTWENDVFELFFKPAEDRPPYYEFQVTPLNTHFDCYVKSRSGGWIRRWTKAHKFTWETKPVLRGTLDGAEDRDEGWSVEGKIPWTDFRHTGGKPKGGDVWRFALCRYDYSIDFELPDLTTTAPLTQADFHLTAQYGRLTFDEK